MSYLARLKQEISHNGAKSGATKGTEAPFDTFVAPVLVPSRDIFAINAEQRREFELLLAIVATAHHTPTDEYDELRETAEQDLPAALVSFRDMAKQIERR
jgi:hypothetical protein